ncbi:cell division cycle-associated protein 3-like [Plakobranchus ocellatus]|uniref:Cell division cycle-associated protein 3-like n=1 Tax=Plakobranchus ocellatus TaxID=259542 RepID=A0AAV4DE77_9GAST|nr:cell division cycle-associated protein 3-like [Plakobranchus ocellatus]
MGLLQSLQIEENVQDIQEEDAQESTPVRPVNKRLLSLDPRSPSEGINRTPIIVEKTPVPSAQPTAPHAAVAPDSIEDPRSPSVDFTRTPINLCSAKERHRVRIPPSMLENSTSRVTLGSESGIESAEVTPTRDAFLGQSLDSPDSAFSVEEDKCSDKPADLANGSPSPSSSSGPALPSSLPPSEGDDSRTLSMLTPVHLSSGWKSEDTPKLPVLRSRPPALSKLAVEAAKLSASPNLTRSPLSSVGNARAEILQQNKGRLLSTVDHQGVSRNAIDAIADKENCFR